MFTKKRTHTQLMILFCRANGIEITRTHNFRINTIGFHTRKENSTAQLGDYRAKKSMGFFCLYNR